MGPLNGGQGSGQRGSGRRRGRGGCGRERGTWTVLFLSKWVVDVVNEPPLALSRCEQYNYFFFFLFGFVQYNTVQYNIESKQYQNIYIHT